MATHGRNGFVSSLGNAIHPGGTPFLPWAVTFLGGKFCSVVLEVDVTLVTGRGGCFVPHLQCAIVI